MTGFEEIGQNDNFWAKMAIFGPFLGQKGEIYIFREEIFLGIFLRPKTEFL